MFKLNSKTDTDFWLHPFGHFECDGHTVHMLTQQHLLPPLTSTVKSSLFTLVHSSPLSLAARPQRHANHSHYINNSWTFSGLPHTHTHTHMYACMYTNIYIYIYIYTHTHTHAHRHICETKQEKLIFN